VVVAHFGHPTSDGYGGLLMVQSLALVLADGHHSSSGGGGGLGLVLVLLLIVWLLTR